MPIYSEIIARAETLAQSTGKDSQSSAVIDGTMTAEAIYPHAVRFCIARALKSGENLHQISSDVALDVRNGEAPLPDTVLRQFLNTDAFVPDDKFSSYLPFEDYKRKRFDTLVRYFSTRNGIFYYSGANPIVLRNVIVPGMYNGVFGVGEFFSTDVGQLIEIRDSGGALQYFGTIADVPSGSVVILTSNVLNDSGIDDYTPIAIYSTVNDQKAREFNDVALTLNSDLANSATAAFTSVDVGRRLRVSSGGAIVLDAVILAVNSATQVRVAAKATGSVTGGAGAVVFSAVILNVPTAPAAPSSPSADSGLSDKLADSVVVTIAGVMSGAIPLGVLMEE